jgi:hypothetical protein
MAYQDRQRAKEIRHRYYVNHLDKWAQWNATRVLNHPKEVAEAQKRYRKRHPEKVKAYPSVQPELMRERMRKWRKEHQDEARKQAREHARLWRKAHPEEMILRRAVAIMFLGSDLRKSFKSRKYVGCSSGFLRNHLESLFLPGMSWKNWGRADRDDGRVWHMDHIVPLSWFPFDEDPSLLYVASHWSNLRPMWGQENQSKGNRHAA